MSGLWISTPSISTSRSWQSRWTSWPSRQGRGRVGGVDVAAGAAQHVAVEEQDPHRCRQPISLPRRELEAALPDAGAGLGPRGACHAEPGSVYVDRETGEEMEPVAMVLPLAPSARPAPHAGKPRACRRCDQLIGLDVSDCPTAASARSPLKRICPRMPASSVARLESRTSVRSPPPPSCVHGRLDKSLRVLGKMMFAKAAASTPKSSDRCRTHRNPLFPRQCLRPKQTWPTSWIITTKTFP
jgi:hypothetical protein